MPPQILQLGANLKEYGPLSPLDGVFTSAEIGLSRLVRFYGVELTMVDA